MPFFILSTLRDCVFFSKLSFLLQACFESFHKFRLFPSRTCVRRHAADKLLQCFVRQLFKRIVTNLFNYCFVYLQSGFYSLPSSRDQIKRQITIKNLSQQRRYVEHTSAVCFSAPSTWRLAMIIAVVEKALRTIGSLVISNHKVS